MEAMNKCYIEELALRKLHAYVLRKKSNDEEGKATAIMKIPSMVHHMQITHQCMKVFFLTGLQKFFGGLKPVEIDARRCHEFLTFLQEDGTCQVTDKDGGKVELLVDGDKGTQAHSSRT